MRPPLVSDRPPKHQNFPSQNLTVGTSSKRPSPVSNRDHFLGVTIKDILLFLTSCKRPLDSFFDFYFRSEHYVTLNIRRTLVTEHGTARILTTVAQKGHTCKLKLYMQAENITNMKHEFADGLRPGHMTRTRSSSLILRAQDFSFLICIDMFSIFNLQHNF